MMAIESMRFIVVTFLLACFSAGCIGGTSQRSVYYVLNASQAISPLPGAVPGGDIGIGPIKLPGFLDRPEIITRQGENHLKVNEFHRWGDSLEAQINYVLAENLSARLDTLNVIIYPWERPLAPAYQIYIDVRRFDGKPGETVTLQAMWWVIDTADDAQLSMQRSSIAEPTGSDTFEAYVAAQNMALERLSLEIAEGLIKHLQ